MKFEKLKTIVGKLKAIVVKLTNTVGKLTTGFIIINIIMGLGALIYIRVTGEAGNAKIFYSCEGILVAALFNVALAIIAGLSYKDEETKIGRVATAIAVVNTIVGLAPLIGTCIVGEAENIKIFYSCAGMFFTTSFDVLLAIMVGMSFDVSE